MPLGIVGVLVLFDKVDQNMGESNEQPRGKSLRQGGYHGLGNCMMGHTQDIRQTFAFPKEKKVNTGSGKKGKDMQREISDLPDSAPSSVIEARLLLAKTRSFQKDMFKLFEKRHSIR